MTKFHVTCRCNDDLLVQANEGKIPGLTSFTLDPKTVTMTAHFADVLHAYPFAHHHNACVKRSDGVTLCPPATELDQKRATKRAAIAARVPGVNLGVRLDADIRDERCDNLVVARAAKRSKRKAA